MSEAVALPPPVTIAAFDDFLAVQRDDESWELVDGRIMAMTNPSLGHEEIVGNVSTALRSVIPADRRCRVTVGGVRAQVSEDVGGLYAPRPDLMVWCGPMHGERNFVTTPLVFVEVLSPSNMDTDRGAKLRFYKNGFPTLRNIVLVYQDQMRVECYDRTDTGWDLVTLARPDDALALAALTFAMPLSDVHKRTTVRAG